MIKGFLRQGLVLAIGAGAGLLPAHAGHPAHRKHSQTRPAPQGKKAPHRRPTAKGRKPGHSRTARPAHPVRPATPVAKPVPSPSHLEGAEHLDRFFQSLTALERTPDPTGVIRVLQFGDSHTAADYWTGALRQSLQARFGDAGPGLLLPVRPWRGYHHAGVRETFSTTWPSTSLRSREGDGLVGLTGGAISLPSGACYRLEAPFRSFSVQTLGPAEDRPSLSLVRPGSLYPALPAVPPSLSLDPVPAVALAGPEALPGGPLLPPLNLTETTLAQPGGNLLRTLNQAALAVDGPMELTVTVPASSRLLGVDLRSGRPGITYEELGLNGAELFDLTRWNPELRRTLLGQAAPGLVVLAYGTNDMGRGDLDLVDYRTRATALFRQLAQESGAPILVVGPVDRGAKKRKALAGLRQGARTVIEALRLAARDAHCAFWDSLAAMGGPGTLVKWRKAGWAQNDLVHLTGPGYTALGRMQFEALMSAFAAFRRNQN